MARFNPSLHPRDRNGRFRSKGGSTRSVQPRKGGGVQRTVRTALAANAVRRDTISAYAHAGAAAATFGAGAYHLTALHSAKAGTATNRLLIRGSRAQIRGSKVSAGRKTMALKKIDKIEVINNRVDFIAGAGLSLSYGKVGLGGVKSEAMRRTVKRATASQRASKTGIGSTAFRPTAVKPSRSGVYKVTTLKGSKLRR
jgi:hypothetical protein